MRSTIETTYPQKERDLFTDREVELAILSKNTEQIINGSGENICFIGLRRIGKSLLLKEQILRLSRLEHKISGAYMDFERLDTTPEFFAVQYVGQIVRWFPDDENIAPYLDIDVAFDFPEKFAKEQGV